MDILNLVDRLEELFERGWRVPLSRKVAMDEEAFLNIIDQMRITIPQEIKQARDIQQERERHIAQARDEARQIIAQAREDATRLLDEHKMRQAAEAQAEAIIKRAQKEAAQIRAGADQYAETKLAELAQEVANIQVVIRNGIEALQSRRAQLQQPQQQAAVAAPGSQTAPAAAPKHAQT